MANLWVRKVEPKRKSCPACKAKLGSGESVWSMGRYVRGRWYSVDDMHGDRRFCRECFEDFLETCGYNPSVHDIVSREPVPYWLEKPGMLTERQLWTLRQMSDILGFPLVMYVVGGGGTVSTKTLTFGGTHPQPHLPVTLAWDTHPLNDWCQEHPELVYTDVMVVGDRQNVTFFLPAGEPDEQEIIDTIMSEEDSPAAMK